MKKLCLFILLAAPAWAGDIYIISPKEGEAVNGILTIQAHTPYGEPEAVDTWITLDVDHGPDRVMWRGKLSRKDNYTVKLDISKFPAGEYELDMRYFHAGRIFDADTEFYIWPQPGNAPPPPPYNSPAPPAP